eukprot:gene13369-biopygen22494
MWSPFLSTALLLLSVPLLVAAVNLQEPVICVQYGATVQEQYQAKETTLGNGALKRYVEKDLEDMESHVEQPYTWFTSNEERKSSYDPFMTIPQQCPALPRGVSLADLQPSLRAIDAKLWPITHKSPRYIDGKLEELPFLPMSDALTPLTALTSLEEAILSGFPDTSLAALQFCTALRSLDLQSLQNLTDLSGLSAFCNLNVLKLSLSMKLKDITALSGCPNLHTLTLDGSYVQELTALSACCNLRILDLKSLWDISALSECSNLHALNLNCCTGLEDHATLSAVSIVHSLDLSYWERLQDITALTDFPNLHTLSLNGCKGLQDITALTDFPNLHTLGTDRCSVPPSKLGKRKRSRPRKVVPTQAANSFSNDEVAEGGGNDSDEDAQSDDEEFDVDAQPDDEGLTDEDAELDERINGLAWVSSSEPHMTILSHCPALQSVRMFRAPRSVSLAGLPPSLRTIDVDLRRYLRMSPVVGGLRGLQLSSALSPLTALTRLEEAVLSCFPDISLAALQFCTALRSLDLPDWPSLTNLSALIQWAAQIEQRSNMAQTSQAGLGGVSTRFTDDALWQCHDALLLCFDSETRSTWRLVCRRACEGVEATTRCLVWDGANEGSSSDPHMTILQQCPVLQRVRLLRASMGLILAGLPPSLRAIEVTPRLDWCISMEGRRLTAVQMSAALSPLTALTRLEEAVLHGFPDTSLATLQFCTALRSMDLLNWYKTSDFKQLPINQLLILRATRKEEEALKKAALAALAIQSEQAKVDKQLEKVNRTQGKNSGRDVMAGKSQVCISVAAPASACCRSSGLADLTIDRLPLSALAVAATPPAAAASPARAPAVAATPSAAAATLVNPPAARG